MKRVLLTILIILICVICSSCSLLVNFVVINASNMPLEVEYRLVAKVESVERTSTKPYKMTLKAWNSWFGNKEWQEVSINDYEFNKETGKCKTTLAPNEVLRITWQNDSITFEERSEHFLIDTINLTGINGQITYTGKYLYKQFSKKDEGNFFIIYK